MSQIRNDRMNEEVKKTVSEIIREMKDPRIPDMTALTECRVTKDLKYAKIRVSVYDPEDAVRKKAVEALNHAAGFVAHELGERMRIRCIPKLQFVLDESIAYSIRIGRILDELHISHDDPESGAAGENEES